MAQRDLAEAARHRDVLRVVERLVAEHEHLVNEQRRAQGRRQRGGPAVRPNLRRRTREATVESKCLR